MDELVYVLPSMFLYRSSHLSSPLYIAKNSLNPAKMSKNNAINFKNIPKKPKAFNLAVLQGMGEKPDFYNHSSINIQF